ncbi:MAG: hypothetical protein R2784_06940 [Saprospiraceae bacterium]
MCNCDDLEIGYGRGWVMDEAGNSDYVIVQVDVRAISTDVREQEPGR